MGVKKSVKRRDRRKAKATGWKRMGRYMGHGAGHGAGIASAGGVLNTRTKRKAGHELTPRVTVGTSLTTEPLANAARGAGRLRPSPVGSETEGADR